MADINKASFIIPELLSDAVSVGFSGGLNLLMGSEAVVMNPSLPTEKRGGDVVKVPYFGNIGEFEAVADGVALTPVALTSTSETATVARTGKMIEITNWAEVAANYADPYAELAKQMVAGAQRAMDSALITAARAANAPMTYTVPATGTINYDAVVKAKMLFADEQDDIAAIAMHSKVWGDCLSLKDSTGRPLAVENIGADGKSFRQFGGMNVLVSDKLTPASSVYDTLLLKRSSLVAWYNPAPAIDEDKDIAKATRKAAINLYFVAYRYKNMPGLTKPGVAILKSA